MRLDRELIEIGSWTHDPARMHKCQNMKYLRQSEDYMGHARNPREQLTSPSIGATTQGKEAMHQDTYRWNSLRHSSPSAQQSHINNSNSAAASCTTFPSKLHKHRQRRGLSNDLSVSETEFPGQPRVSAVRNTPRSCDSLELGALDDRMSSCDDLSSAFKRWINRCATDDPWVAYAALVAGNGEHGGLLDDEGASRRGFAIVICD
jgi:hypothetical protein